MSFLHPTHRITDLQSHLQGSLLTPDDPAYEESRKSWNLLFDPHPAYILLAETSEDVAAGVRFANEAGIGVAIQSTGHGIREASDGGLLIVTSAMQAVTVDPVKRAARAESGARWHHVIDAAAPHGLAPLLGSSPHVGVIGYSLGGGIGWLARRYGLAADQVTAVDLVTASGDLIRASANENPDLFWGLRGAGAGGFGVITAIEFNLVPVSEFYGGFMSFPASVVDPREVLRRYRDWVASAPDDLTSSITVVKFPSLPQLPEALRGAVQTILRAVWLGDPADGAALLEPWAAWHTPAENTFRVMPFTDIAKVSNDPVNPTAGDRVCELLDTLPDAAIDIIVQRTASPDSPMMMSEIRHAGGAISRVDKSANAVGSRDAQFYLQFGGTAFTPEMLPAIESYIPEFQSDLRPYTTGGAYLNLTNGSHSAARIHDAYPDETFARLAALKSRLDPHNLFRFGLNFHTAE